MVKQGGLKYFGLWDVLVLYILTDYIICASTALSLTKVRNELCLQVENEFHKPLLKYLNAERKIVFELVLYLHI